MTQEDKELLLKDLCARLLYGVKAMEYEDEPPFTIDSYDKADFIDDDNWIDSDGWNHNITKTKPYLFPLSSMTEEQWRELFKTAGYEVREEDCGRHTEMYYYDMVGHDNTLYPNCDGVDWLNAHHFDYRGLIEKGLALDATGLNIY